MAELMYLPAYDQLRILHEQKYPKASPNVFKIPYYRPALSAIRAYYASGNKTESINRSISEIESKEKNNVRRQNNLRVIGQFLRSEQTKRTLTLSTGGRFKLPIGKVELKMHFDLSAQESNNKKHIYYNFRTAPCVPEVAIAANEISAYILEKHGFSGKVKEIQFVDLHDGRVHVSKAIKAKTIKMLNANVKIIESLWDSI
jgi:hypothetical protein